MEPMDKLRSHVGVRALHEKRPDRVPLSQPGQDERRVRRPFERNRVGSRRIQLEEHGLHPRGYAFPVLDDQPGQNVGLRVAAGEQDLGQSLRLVPAELRECRRGEQPLLLAPFQIQAGFHQRIDEQTPDRVEKFDPVGDDQRILLSEQVFGHVRGGISPPRIVRVSVGERRRSVGVLPGLRSGFAVGTRAAG